MEWKKTNRNKARVEAMLNQESSPEDSRTASLDDKSLSNLASELGAEDRENLQSLLDRITQLVEFIENDKLNAMLNFPLYGLLIRNLSALQCLKPLESLFLRHLDEYTAALDAIETRLKEEHLEDGTTPIATLPALVNAMRNQKTFTNKNKKKLTAL
ncbi:MAG: hypothetical protein KAG97_05365, partial [Victivallales bacterium]|nr:hypothetical protein [Victivallales bacterium]